MSAGGDDEALRFQTRSARRIGRIVQELVGLPIARVSSDGGIGIGLLPLMLAERPAGAEPEVGDDPDTTAQPGLLEQRGSNKDV